jgi:hypothetical protein
LSFRVIGTNESFLICTVLPACIFSVSGIRYKTREILCGKTKINFYSLQAISATKLVQLIAQKMLFLPQKFNNNDNWN